MGRERNQATNKTQANATAVREKALNKILFFTKTLFAIPVMAMVL